MDQFWDHIQILQENWWPFVIAFIITLISCIRIYVGGKTCPSNNRIDGKIVLITGGCGGLGMATAEELIERGAHIILAIRNARKGKLALQKLLQKYPKANVIAKLLDVSNFNNIREFVNQMILEYDRIDILINNAGIIFHPYTKTVDDNELTIATNYFGPFLLTHLLLPLLNKSDNGRVINISSMAHYDSNIKLDDLNSVKNYDDTVFSQSKLALTIFTRYMAELLETTNITFIAVSPGLVKNTGHLRKSKLINSTFTKFMVWPWIWLFLKTPKQGCQSIVYAAVEPFFASLSGIYINNCEIQEPAKVVGDIKLAKKLYKETCKIVDIKRDMIEKLFHH